MNGPRIQSRRSYRQKMGSWIGVCLAEFESRLAFLPTAIFYSTSNISFGRRLGIPVINLWHMLTSASSWMTSFSISFVIKWKTLSCNAFSRHKSSCSIISAVEGDRDGNCDSDRSVTDQTSFKSDETSFDLNSPFNIVSWIRSNWTGSDNNGISDILFLRFNKILWFLAFYKLETQAWTYFT